jgi:hypothetical protein
MRARTNPWLALIAIMTGACAAIAATPGCGSKTDEGTVTPPDTGLAIQDSTAKDTTPVDTGTTVVDSATQYDVPGSLFDVAIPDAVFEGGKTAAGCFDCTTDKCKDEVAACDADPRCRGLVLCSMTDCAGSFTDTSCLFSCALKFGVTGTDDPILPLAMAVGNCVQKECSAACPLPPDAGGDTKAETAVDSAATDSAETGAFMIFPNSSEAPSKKVDPKVIEMLAPVFSTLGAMPEVRAELIEKFSAPR